MQFRDYPFMFCEPKTTVILSLVPSPATSILILSFLSTTSSWFNPVSLAVVLICSGFTIAEGRASNGCKVTIPVPSVPVPPITSTVSPSIYASPPSTMFIAVITPAATVIVAVARVAPEVWPVKVTDSASV